MDIIQHDVRRLDRLITDISDASRLDAELAREDAARDRPRQAARECRGHAPGSCRSTRRTSTLKLDNRPAQVAARRLSGSSAMTAGIGQVINNLIDNARSFVPDGDGRIEISLSRAGRHGSRSSVEDNGPGIRAENIERIFERFYTDRPERRLRPEFRPRPVDLAPDHRGAWRHADRREPHAAGARGRAVHRAPAGSVPAK